MKKILLIIIFAAFIVLYSVQIHAVPVERKQVPVPKGTVANEGGSIRTNPPPGYKGDWVFEKTCSNGAGDWVCKGKCTEPQQTEPREREPKEKPVPTPTPTTTTNIPNFNSNLIPNPQWTSVLGYTSSFNQCNSLCAQYQQNNCDSQSALQYCNAVVSVDLNKNGKISSSEIGSTPSGTRNCETNLRCYDVIPSCACGNQPLDIGSCISMLYQAYTKTGLSLQQALQNVAQETTSGCRPPQT